MIRFRTNTTIDIYDNRDEEDAYEQTFEQGECVDADVFREDDETADIEFGDGKVALCVLKDEIEVM
jgi:hypothetical protein